MEIPLFPLKTVLFPGMELPLRIFEERYKAMTRELIASGGEFGVLLIKSGPEIGNGATTHTIGTTARIEEWTELEDGRFAITARGIQRFELIQTLPPRPYPYGEIRKLSDVEPPSDAALAMAMASLSEGFGRYFRLVLSMTDQWARETDLPRRPHALVNRLGQLLDVDEKEKQAMLEGIDPLDRLSTATLVVAELLAETISEAADYRRRKYEAIGVAN